MRILYAMMRQGVMSVLYVKDVESVSSQDPLTLNEAQAMQATGCRQAMKEQ